MRTWQTRVAAILTIGGLDGYALYLGHNGIMLATALAIIGGIAGYELGIEKLQRSIDRGQENA